MHTYINMKYRAGVRRDNTLPCVHQGKDMEVYFEGHRGKERSLGWDCQGKTKSWQCGYRKWVTLLELQIGVGGSLGCSCPLFCLAEPLTKLIPTNKT